LGSERPSLVGSDWLRDPVPQPTFTNIERIEGSIEDQPHLTALIEMSMGFV
jgi:hypothetical protein